MKRALLTIAMLFCVCNAHSTVFKFIEVDPFGVQQNEGNNLWRMTTNDDYTNSALWNDKTDPNKNDDIDLNYDFELRFRAWFGDLPANPCGADGIAFVLRKTDAREDIIGGDGKRIGYFNILNSFGIEFDTYQDDEIYSDVEFDHVAYHFGNSQYPNMYIGDLEAIYKANGTPQDVENGTWYDIFIQWKANTKQMITYVNGIQVKAADLSGVNDIVTHLDNPIDNKVRWGFTSATGCCFNNQKIDIVSLYQNKDISFDLSGKDICNASSSATWSVTNINGGVPPYRYEWYYGNTLLGEEPSIALNQEGNYRVRVYDAVRFFAEKTFKVYNKDFNGLIKITTPLCDGNPGLLEPEMYNGRYPYTYKWYKDNILISTDRSLPITETDNYRMEVFDADDCMISDTKNVTIDNSTLYLHDKYGVCLGASVKLDAKVNGGKALGDGHIYWSPTDGLDQPYDNLNPIASPSQDMIYTATYISPSGCEISRKCTVYVKTSDLEFAKKIENTVCESYTPQFLFNGLTRIPEFTYIPQADFECGYLIHGLANLEVCHSIVNRPFATAPYIIKLDEDARQLTSKIYNNNSVNSGQPFFYNLSYFHYPNNDAYENIYYREDNKALVIGTLTSVTSHPNLFGIILNKNLSSYNDLSIPNFKNGFRISEPNTYLTPIKSVQDNLDYIYLLAKKTNEGAINRDITITKFDPRDLINPVWKKSYSTDTDLDLENDQFNDEPYDMIVDGSGNLIVVGKSNANSAEATDYQSFALKVNSGNGDPIAIKYYRLTPQNIPNSALRVFEHNQTYYLIGEIEGNPKKIQLLNIDNTLQLLTNNCKVFGSPNYSNITLGSARIENNNKLTFSTDLHDGQQIQFITWDLTYKSIDNHFRKNLSDIYELPTTLSSFYSKNFMSRYQSDGIVQLSELYDGSIANDGLFIKISKSKGETTTPCYNSGSLEPEGMSIDISTNETIRNYDWLATVNEANIGADDLNLVELNDACGVKEICHCGSNKIEVTFTPEESTIGSTSCCYKVKFKVKDLANTCSISKVQIGNWSQGFEHPLAVGDEFTFGPFCPDEFTGTANFMIKYLDANNNVVCATSQKINCKCNCSETQSYSDNIKITVEPSGDTPEECCYDVFIENLNDCLVKNQSIKINYGNDDLDGVNNLRFTPTAGIGLGNAIKNDNNNSIVLTGTDFTLLGGQKKNIGLICVARSNAPKKVDFTFTNYICEKKESFDLGCKATCCDLIDNKITFERVTSQNPDECCFNLNFHFVEIPECMQGLEDGISLRLMYNGTALQTLNSITPSTTPTDYQFCIPESAMHSLPMTMAFKLEFVVNVDGKEVILCSKELPAVPKCKDCCEDIEVVANPFPQTDDGTQCCYYLNVSTIGELGCGGLSHIRITSDAGVEFFTAPLVPCPPGNIYLRTDYCIPKSAIPAGATTMPLKVHLYNSLGQEVCVKDIAVEPCNNNISIPCTPDGNPNDWIKVTGKSLTVPCSPVPCYVTYNFAYRMFSVPGGLTYRDIQVTNYGFNSGCLCQDAVIKAILAAITSDPVVMAHFGIPGLAFPPPDNKACVTDYRVIASDCWTTSSQQTSNGGYEFLNKCNTDVCCYSKYEVCYKLDPSQGITFYNSRKLDSYFLPKPCPPQGTEACTPNNCIYWGPTHFDPPNVGTHKIGVDANRPEQIISDECIIIQSDLENKFNISLNDKEKGQLKIQFFNLLGELVDEANFNKDQNQFITELEPKLNNGSYICRVNLNGNALCIKKFIVIK